MRSLAVAAGVLLAASGCALMHGREADRAARIEPLLTAAGFQAVPAKTPEQQQHLESLPTLRLQYSTRGGKPHYWYADPYRCRCLYTGSEAQYAKYEALLVQRQIAQDERAQRIADEDAASIDRQMDFWLPPEAVMPGTAWNPE